MKHAHHFTACALLAAAAMLTTACSSGEADIEPKPAEPKEQPADTPSTIHFTATLAPKGDDDALTRAVDSKGVTKWVRGEQIAVYYQTANGPTSTTVSVESVNDGFATISGELPNAVAGDAKFVYPASLHDGQGGINEERLLNNQNGRLTGTGSISSDFDAATADGKIIIDGDVATVKGTVTMNNQVCICKFTLCDVSDSGSGSGSISDVKIFGNTLTIFDNNGHTYTITSAFTQLELNGAGGLSQVVRPFKENDMVYVAMLPIKDKRLIISSSYNGKYYGMITNSGTLTEGTFYNKIYIEMIENFTYIAGKHENTTITIPDGGTLTLVDADITAEINKTFPAIECRGDATIIIEGINSVNSGYDCPGIQAGPNGKVLTISGNGSLTARGGDHGAGIGSGYGKECGNITISGGIVNATGGVEAAGIGSGDYGQCGNITIENTVTKVTATKGDEAEYCIGKGNHGSCGRITIGGAIYGSDDEYLKISPFVYPLWN